jgi:hypothetical protein
LLLKTTHSIVIDQQAKIIKDTFSSLLLFCFLLGQGIGSWTTDIWNKPVIFCMPDQKKIAQKTILTIWFIIIGPLCAAKLIFLTKNALDFGLFLELIALASLSYWAGICILLRDYKFFLYPIFFKVFTTLIIWSLTLDSTEVLLTKYPFPIIAISFLLTYLIFRGVKQIELRDFSSNNAPSNFGFVYNTNAIKKFEQALMLKFQNHGISRFVDFADVYFSGRIKSQQKSPLFAHLWGRVYLILGPFLPRFWRICLTAPFLPAIIIWLLMYFIGGDLFIFEMTIFFVMALLFSAIIFSVQRYHLFLLIGRREQFCGRVIESCIYVLIFLILMSISILLNKIASAMIPASSLFGATLVVKIPMSWIFLIIPVIILPLFGAAFILFRNHQIMLITALIIAISCSAIFAVYMFVSQPHMSFILNSMILLTATILVWGTHIAALYYDSMKRSLC